MYSTLPAPVSGIMQPDLPHVQLATDLETVHCRGCNEEARLQERSFADSYQQTIHQLYRVVRIHGGGAPCPDDRPHDHHHHHHHHHSGKQSHISQWSFCTAHTHRYLSNIQDLKLEFLNVSNAIRPIWANRPGSFEPPPNHLQTDFVYSPPQPKPPIVFKMMISVCIASITERELSAPLDISMANHEYRYQISLVAGSHDASRPSIICGVHIRV